MRRGALVVLAGYLLVALGNKFVEKMGGIGCACAVECWCQNPGFSFFRWVFPWGHRAAREHEDQAPMDHSTLVSPGAGETPTGSP